MNEIVAKIIKLEDWEQFGEGGVGKSYYHKTDGSLILKLNVEDWPEERTYNEYQQALYFHKLGLPSPAVYDFVTDGKRFGYTSERIMGKVSLARVAWEDPSSLPHIASVMAGMAAKLHSVQADKSCTRDILSISKSIIDSCTAIPDDVRRILDAYYHEHDLNASTCIHGDLQPGNIIVSGDMRYWIDLGGFGYGDPCMDIANMYMICYLLPPQMVPGLFHMSRRNFRKLYKLFLECYFGDRLDDALLLKIKHMALYRAGICVAVKPESAALFLPAIRGKKLQFAIVSFLSRFVKASV